MYNGYTNFQTWSIFAYISNEEPVYNHYQSLIADLQDPAEDLARILQHDFTELPEGIRSPYREILAAALEDVNFPEVARAFID